jgi:hypothetical protein
VGNSKGTPVNYSVEHDMMNPTTLAFGLGLLLLAAGPAPAQIIKGVMSIKGAEMS